ncbi:hypothetical protein XA68_11042 [Ophiocordyceps unilateralis]|uniref:Mitochondrial import inner membrane translocase subunit n=1 Tax=Ophiocordyceps unilateralis TaxID=268505 RepID=A0A2A9PG64_OPHUN|nr:hypothetical protein XA68_11042 [Ophiocordyceps unilateralis]
MGLNSLGKRPAITARPSLLRQPFSRPLPKGPLQGRSVGATSQLTNHQPNLSSSQLAPIMDSLSSAEQRLLEQRIQKRQVKEFTGVFGSLVEHCFISCVDDFTSKALSTRENGCISRCVNKWMASQQRLSERFQEHNARLSQQMQNK